MNWWGGSTMLFGWWDVRLGSVYFLEYRTTYASGSAPGGEGGDDRG